MRRNRDKWQKRALMINGMDYDLVDDGGFTNWTRKLLSSEKERLLTSGIGTELLLKAFRTKL